MKPEAVMQTKKQAQTLILELMSNAFGEINEHEDVSKMVAAFEETEGQRTKGFIVNRGGGGLLNLLICFFFLPLESNNIRNNVSGFIPKVNIREEGSHGLRPAYRGLRRYLRFFSFVCPPPGTIKKPALGPRNWGLHHH